MNRSRPFYAAALGGTVWLAAIAMQSEAATSDVPDGGPALPRFDAEPFSEEKTTAPTLAEWKTQTPVALTDPLPFSECRAYRLREWVKIRCSKHPTSSLALVGGARDGVLLWVDPAEGEFRPPQGGEVIFPVRRGDRRVFEWSTFGEAYDGPGFPVISFMISESWAPDEPGPTIIAQ